MTEPNDVPDMAVPTAEGGAGWPAFPRFVVARCYSREQLVISDCVLSKVANSRRPLPIWSRHVNLTTNV